jgi:hypothetical protein
VANAERVWTTDCSQAIHRMKAPLGGTIESRRRYNACYPAGHETYNYNYAPFALGIETGQFGPLALGGALMGRLDG